MNGKFCVKCGSELREKSHYCDACGAKWKLPKNHKTESKEETEFNYKRRTSLFFIPWSALTVLMLITIVILVVKITTGTETNRGKKVDTISDTHGNSITGKDIDGTWMLTYDVDSWWENDLDILGFLGGAPGSRNHLVIEMQDDLTGTAKVMEDNETFAYFHHASMDIKYEDASITMTAEEVYPITEHKDCYTIKITGTVYIKNGKPYMEGVCYTTYTRIEDNKFYTTMGRFTAEK